MTDPIPLDIPPVETQRAETQALTERIRKRGVCEWTKKFIFTDDIVWSTACGNDIHSNDDMPVRHRFKFCVYCGKEILAK